MARRDEPVEKSDPQNRHETDERFPSGPWEGFYLMKHTGLKRHMMEMILQFTDGSLTGEGRDAIGKFTMSGNYSTETGKCNWKKSYIRRHNVIYDGYNEGRGIFGGWEIREIISGMIFQSTGSFLIWPKSMGDPTNHRRKAEADLPQKEQKQKISEEDFAIVSAATISEAESETDE